MNVLENFNKTKNYNMSLKNKKMAESDKYGSFVFTWKIKNFRSFVLTNNQNFKSSSFRIKMLDNSEWQLWLQLKEDYELVLNLYRLKRDEGPTELMVNWKITILNNNSPSFFIEKPNIHFVHNSVLSQPMTPLIEAVFNKDSIFDKETLVIQSHIWNSTTKDFVICSASSVVSEEHHHFSLPVCYILDNIFLSVNEVSLQSVSKKYPDFVIYCTKQQEQVNLKIHMAETSFLVFVRCVIAICELNDSRQLLLDDDHCFEIGSANKVWNLPDIFHPVISDLKSSGEKSYKIDIDLYVSDGTQNSSIESVVYTSRTSDSKEIIQTNYNSLLHKQLKHLYNEGILHDFTITSKDREFKIHKSIFGAVSPVFRAMFELNMSEKENSTVTIEDIDSDTLDLLISYVYTDKVPDLEWSIILKLYAAAEKYHIIDLKQKCTRLLKIKLDLENVLEALTMADMYEDKLLKTFLKSIIRENSQTVLKSEKWNSFMKEYSTLACEVMYEICVP